VTLAEAIAEMNHCSATRIVIEDPGLASERISGTFPTGAQEDFAEAFTLYAEAELTRDEGRTLIVPAYPRAGRQSGHGAFRPCQPGPAGPVP